MTEPTEASVLIAVHRYSYMKLTSRRDDGLCSALDAACTIFTRRISLASGSLWKLAEFRICGEKDDGTNYAVFAYYAAILSLIFPDCIEFW